jgi:hypothetical protein
MPFVFGAGVRLLDMLLIFLFSEVPSLNVFKWSLKDYGTYDLA